MSSENYPTDEIKRKPMEIKDEQVDDYQQEEPILNNASYRVNENESTEIKDELVDDVVGINQEEPTVDMFCPATATSRPFDQSAHKIKNYIPSTIQV
ncbi:hypothetical protein PMAYCL1PPCAC_01161, partial [Pristionchus mayeri]